MRLYPRGLGALLWRNQHSGSRAGGRQERTNQLGACALGCFFIPRESPGIRFAPPAPRSVRESHKASGFPSFTHTHTTHRRAFCPTCFYESVPLRRTIQTLHSVQQDLCKLADAPSSFPAIPDRSSDIPEHSPRARFTNDVRFYGWGLCPQVEFHIG